ncbi:MAG: dihydrodipicolinate reductase [Bacteroidetes bacterium]|nr:dihydrodipicolinate reductase [Bacteroidota bacterium]
MKIGLFGFGKTGRAVAAVILSNPSFSLEWVLRRKPLLENREVAEYLGIESSDPGKIYATEHIEFASFLAEHPVDILIDFSSASGVHHYGAEAAARGIKIISAISHYGTEEQKLLTELAKQTVVFWSPNITLGVNYLLFAAKFLKKIAPWVDIEIVEEHFKEKKGVSGTAIKIAEVLDLQESDVNSVRAGGIVGKHELIFGFPNQTVRLIHESISREAFGTGVLFVAEQLAKKEAGQFSFEEILLPYFTTN